VFDPVAIAPPRNGQTRSANATAPARAAHAAPATRGTDIAHAQVDELASRDVGIEPNQETACNRNS